MIKSKRKGTFKISAKLINGSPDIVKGIMGQCIILRANPIGSRNLIEYTAISDWFDEIPDFTEPPEYVVETTRRANTGFDFRFARR